MTTDGCSRVWRISFSDRIDPEMDPDSRESLCTRSLSTVLSFEICVEDKIDPMKAV